MRFDWYQATIPEHPITLVESLLARVAPGGSIVEGKGRHNYHQSFTINDVKGDRAAVVLAGGPNGHPNATASGHSTDGFVQVVRELWPGHRVTRFDSAQDFNDQEAWDRLEQTCREVGKERGIKGRAIVPDDLSEGRTYYLGAASSDVRVRLYDKAAETRRKLPEERHGEVPEHWVRLETQVRPRGDYKRVAAYSDPETAWAFAGWTSELAKRAMSLTLARIEMQAGRETDHQRAYRFMLRQYGKVFKQMFADLGSWDCVGKTIGDDLSRHGR